LGHNRTWTVSLPYFEIPRSIFTTITTSSYFPIRGYGEGDVKKLLVAGILIAGAASGPTFAADLRVPAYGATPSYAQPIVYSWTGCYLGAEGGGDWGKSQDIAATSPLPGAVGLPITNNFNVTGGLVGGTLGCNYQFGKVVFGVENDLSWTNIKGTAGDLPPFVAGTTNSINEKWLDTLRGRVGLAWDRLFLYGTGGAAFADIGAGVCSPAGLCASDTQTRTGWVAGGGVEWAVTTNYFSSLTVKLEYLHADFGTGLFFSPPVPIGAGVIDSRKVSLTNNIVRGGINWKFNLLETAPLHLAY
jgi:outer membrane immunogenic protein